MRLNDVGANQRLQVNNNRMNDRFLDVEKSTLKFSLRLTCRTAFRDGLILYSLIHV